ncbi:RNA-directed DNA polymerase, eukaryota [Tanacetum coccineum]
MEGLHVAMDTAMDHGLFRGMSIGLNEYRLSHLLYADDAIFQGEWDENNIKNLITILNCFYLVSGLLLNLSNSNLHGIDVTSHEVSRLANITGYAAARIPFCYLGLPVGSNMGRIQKWNEMIQRVKHRLSKWKVNLLSIGGRFTLIHSVLSSMSIYYMSLFKVPESVIKELERYRSTFLWGRGVNDRKILWVKWDSVLNERDKGDRNDIWVGEHRLRDKFPRVFDMESDKECSIAERWIQDQWAWTWNRNDKWKWEFELDGIFSVHSARKIINSSLLTTSNIVTRWCRNVPIKVNIMMWRLMWDQLPTRMNLADKDIDIPSVLCPICNNELESSDHVFFKCDTAVQLWRRVSRWCELNMPASDNISSMLSWLDTIGVYRRRILEVIVFATVWCIWRFRNRVVFKDSTMKKSLIFESIVINSFHWFSSRCKNHNILWTLWLQNPMLHSFV